MKKRIGLAALVVAAFVVTTLAAPGSSTVASAAPVSPAAVAGKAVTPVDVPADPPPVTADIIGPAAARTVIQSDKLLTRTLDGHDGQARIDDIGSDTTGDPIAEADGNYQIPELHDDYPTASGRFTGAGPERVLSLRYADLDRSAALVLSSASSLVEVKSGGAQLTESPAGGATVQFMDCTLSCADGGSFGPDVNQSPDGGVLSLGIGEAGSENAVGSQWAVRSIDRPTGTALQFVSRWTGQCLTAVGTEVRVTQCDFAPDPTATSQLWTVEGGPSMVQSVGSPGTYLSRLELGWGLTADTGTVWGFVPVEQTGGVLPSWSVAMPGRDASLPSDLATGDLDRAVDASENYADEAAVAWVDESHALHVTVVDYNRPGGVVATDLTGITPQSLTGTIGVEIGDFDGDSRDEIAVLFQNAADPDTGAGSGFGVAFLRYDSPIATSVLHTSTTPVLGAEGPEIATTYAVASGDFTGSGTAQLALSYTRDDRRTPVLEVTAFGPDFSARPAARVDVSGDPIGYDVTPESGCVTIDNGTSWCSNALRLEPALLKAGADPADLSRRQMMLAWSSLQAEQTDSGYRLTPYTCYSAWAAGSPDDPGAPGAAEQPLDLDRLGEKCVLTGDISYQDSWSPYDAQPARHPLQLAPGAYRGRDTASETVPGWEVATVVPQGQAGQLLATLAYYPDEASIDIYYDEISYGTDTQVTLAAYDQDDSSLRLGAPVVVKLESDETPTFIAAAPPAHVDWIYDSVAGTSSFLNISAYPSTNLSMTSSDTSAFDSSTTSEVTSSVALSNKTTAGATIAGGALFFSGSTTIDASIALSATTARAEQNGTKYSASEQLTTSSQTVNDDLLQVKTVSQTIYRYPVLGGDATAAAPASGDAATACDGPCTAYLDIAVPTSLLTVQADVPGKSVDWYQPTWLNGNALSYPVGPLDPDVGDWSIGTGPTAVPQTGVMAQNDFRIGDTTSSTQLVITKAEGTSFTSTAKTSLKQTLDYKQSVKADVGWLGVESAEARFSSEVNLDANEAFGTVDTGSTTSTSTSTLRVGVTNASFGQYAFTSRYYYDEAGVARVVHTVDTTGKQGREWWARNYGAKADPALNLPNAINIDADSKGISQLPRFATLFERQQIRGFEALDSGAVRTGPAIPFASAPLAGDEVTFSVPVHNFSLKEAGNTTVEFYSVPVDSDTGDPVGPPAKIGATKTVASVLPREVVTAYSDPWTAVGPKTEGAAQDWRIFVILNRTADPSSEIHSYRAAADGSANAACPTTKGNDAFERAAAGTVDSQGFMIDPMTGKRATTACGGNNQGWAPISVLGAPTGAARGAASESTDAASSAAPVFGAPARPDASVELAGAGFVTADAAHLVLTEESAVPDLAEGVAVRGVVRVDADADSTAHQRVMIWDGLPDAGGTMVASTTLHGVDADGLGHADFTWTPRGAGTHQLYQMLLGDVGTGRPDAQIVSVNVVADAGAPGEGGSGPDGSGPGSAGSPGSPEAGGRLADTGSPLTVPLFASTVALLLVAGGFLALRSRRRVSSR